MKTLKFFISILLLSVCSVLHAERFSIDNATFEILDETNKTVQLWSYSKPETSNLIIPGSVEYKGSTYSVVEIRGYAGINCADVTNITLPASMKVVSTKSFVNCENVTNIYFPEGMDLISGDAFAGSNLKSIELPSGVKKVYISAFGSEVERVFIKSEEPFTLCALNYPTSYIVPKSLLSKYKTSEVWSEHSNYTTCTEHMIRNIEVAASETGSSVRNVIGDDVVSDVVELKIKGTINSYDVIVLNQKMNNLQYLDLSEATIVACDYPYYGSTMKTEDNILGGYMFNDNKRLLEIKLPLNLVGEIGQHAFYECGYLRSINIPSGVTEIGVGAFDYCRNLTDVQLPKGLLKISQNAFSGANKLTEIKFPPSLEKIGNGAFRGAKLSEIHLPSGLKILEDYAFNQCPLQKVYTYTILPLSISEYTFGNPENAELYLPETSSENYYFAAGWNGFLKHNTFNEPYEYFYLAGDKVLNDNTGYIEGDGENNPDADINPGGGIIVEGEQADSEEPNQSLGDVNVEHDGAGNAGSIIGDNNISADNLNIKINVKGGKWYFFAFPFDIKMDKITMQNGSRYVWRYYDGEERANGKSGWKDVNGNKLNAAQGYIFQCSANDVLVLNIEDVRFKKEDKYNDLVAHMSDNLKDASWNFMGNPYLSYYDLNDMGYSAPVTVWDGTKYVAIRPGDDDYHFTPFEAFFVQKPEGEGSVGFDGDQQMTQTQSKEKKEKQKAARKMLVKQMAGSDNPRKLINLTLNSGEDNDGTRIVFNNAQSMAYETMCDAAKFESQGVIQLFTLGTGNERYAINERPVDNGIVNVGYTAPAAGEYTISAARMDTPVFVKDMKTGALHDLRQGGYTFSTEAGTYAQRIQIWTEGTATGIGRVNTEQATGAEKVYDMSGRAANKDAKGVYIINGEKTLVK